MNEKLLLAMIEYDAGSAERIQHFLKVYQYAQLIGHGEGLDKNTQHILDTVAIVHDIGIRTCLEKYGTDAGPYQEKEGPAIARELLEELGYAPEVIDRVAYLVGHHHTYTNIDGSDYQILVEADFLVNLHERGTDMKGIESTYRKIFRTGTGKHLCRTIYGIEE